MYGSEWCMKGIITSRARKVWWRRCTLARVSGAPVALEPAGTGAVKAARSPQEGSIERKSGALKQYEYPICEITKTGLLPPGVINTGEFVHHRAWVGCVSDAATRLSFYRVLSLARELISCMRADVPRVTTGAAPAHATASKSNSPALQLQRDASPWRAKLGQAPARAAACAA